MADLSPQSGKTFVVEHLDPELEEWSSCEYYTIASECHATGAQFLLSSVSPTLKLSEKLQRAKGLNVETRSVEDIYADKKDKVCLLDPAASKDLNPQDGDMFDIFLFGGILGDDPPRDRTSELRKKGYEGRRLGPVQMSTDTAVRVTRMVVQDRIPVEKIPYIDSPELIINKNESTEMPYRYVKGNDGQPIMPEGMMDLIIKDSEKGLGDLL
ncbi:SAM-dependent RNA methyltransferase [Massariosphaeria phaeospora]|uniref:SAM-dependent RNA methyltransferase n=1 Tax=Massariosphaeria phaeospora TaxID=100035 RepID=A0A7C8I7C8_9PLEO|nr:SAM-dependent RNA methyltransferase [Massariosphaeria phaeospora]